MKRYTKKVDGKSVVKTLTEIVIKKDGKVTYNPTEEMVLADGWTEYITPVHEPTEAELLERAKERKLRSLYDFDESEEVNDCVIVCQGQAIHYWKKVEERTELEKAVRNCMAVGREDYRLDLRDKGISLSLKCEQLLQMLAALEVYAIDCYNKTTDHNYAIKALATLEEVEAYDFKSGYPEKLTFNIQ